MGFARGEIVIQCYFLYQTNTGKDNSKVLYSFFNPDQEFLWFAFIFCFRDV